MLWLSELFSVTGSWSWPFDGREVSAHAGQPPEAFVLPPTAPAARVESLG